MPGVQILNERGEYSATQGCLPPWIRPYLPIVDPVRTGCLLPSPDPEQWFARGKASVINLAGIARNRVNKRLTEGNPSNRQDLLARLQAAKDVRACSERTPAHTCRTTASRWARSSSRPRH